MFHLGIVGHRYLKDDEASAFVAQQSLFILRQMQAEHLDLIALSAIAEGADTLFAEAAIHLDIPLEIVRPFTNYAEDFRTASAKARYEKLRADARHETLLPYSERSDTAYKAAMNWIVDRSEVVVVAWDGQPAVGSGGTGDAVRQLILRKRPWVHLDVVNLSVVSHSGEPGTEEVTK